MVECLSSPFIRLKSPSASFPNIFPNIYSLLATRYFYSKTIFHVWVACSNNSKAVFLWFFYTNYAFRLWPLNTFYTIIKSNSTKLLERRIAVFYLALGEKTPRRCIAADIAMRKHEVAQAQTKCPSALQSGTNVAAEGWTSSVLFCVFSDLEYCIYT